VCVQGGFDGCEVGGAEDGRVVQVCDDEGV